MVMFLIVVLVVVVVLIVVVVMVLGVVVVDPGRICSRLRGRQDKLAFSP